MEFRDNLLKAISFYRKANRTLTIGTELANVARTYRCESFVWYLRYWLTSRPSEKVAMLEKAWASARECLRQMYEAEIGYEYVVTYNQLSIIPWIRFFFSQAKKSRVESAKEAIELGQHVIESLPQVEHRAELATCYVQVSSLIGLIADIEPSDARSPVHLLRQYWKKAKELSEEAALIESSRIGGGLDYEDTMEGGIKSCERALPYVLKTRDNFLIGLTYDFLAMYTALRSVITDDSEIGAKLLSQALSHAEKAKAHYDLISMISPRAGMLWVEFPEPEYLLTTSWFEADPSRKRGALIKAAKVLPHLLKVARSSLYPEAVVDAHHVCSKTLLFLAKLENNTQKKRRFLRQALWHRQESIRIQKETWGEVAVYRVLPLSYLGDVKFELAKTFKSPYGAKRLVQQAIQNKLSSLDAHSSDHNALIRETAEDYYFHWLAKIHSDVGIFSNFLFELGGGEDNLRKAAREFVEAATAFQTLKQPSRVAESHQSAARCYSLMTDRAEAVEHFEEAEKWYETAAATIPVLTDFYRDQATYMAAWNRVEKAKGCHDKQQYAQAAKTYNESAELLKSSRKWSYLSTEYKALSQLESAEDKSRRDLGDEAIIEFQAALEAFLESLISIQIRVKDLESPEETHMGFELLKEERLRTEYCKARIEIEKARVLNKKGDYRDTIERYGRAIEILDEVTAGLPQGPEKNEVEFIATISRAWQIMARAEDEVSPSLYDKASEMFKKLKDVSTSKIARLLVLGHFNYCRALEKASRFFETGKSTYQAAADSYLEAAIGYYLKAGLPSASEHAIGTKRLLEGKVMLNVANREKDPEKKAQIYSAAEKILNSAFKSFGELGEIARRDDVLRTLEKVRDEKELALSIIGDLASRVILSANTIPIKAPSGERPVGVEIFRSAYVQANLVASSSNPKIGEPLNLSIELANAGMSPAQLVKVEKVVPDGFELVRKPGEFLIQEAQHLMLKGRRLEPLKTAELNLVLKPKVEGPLALKPRIHYFDENGQGRVHEPNPVEIIVQGDAATGRVPLPAAVETLQNSPIIKFLTDAFVEDYMRRRLSLDHSGWRGLPDIVRSLSIPRSQVYGDARYKHTFGKPLERLVKKGIVEFRVFPGMRGRGGNVVRVRISYEKEPVKRFVDRLALTLPS